MIFCYFLDKNLINMKLSERLNVLIQAIALSQKSGILTLDDAVKAKSAIDIISTGTLNQIYVSAINALIEIIVSSQKKGIYSLKDAYMIYLAINGIEDELQNEANKINEGMKIKEIDQTQTHLPNNDSAETIINVAPKVLKKKS